MKDTWLLMGVEEMTWEKIKNYWMHWDHIYLIEVFRYSGNHLQYLGKNVKVQEFGYWTYYKLVIPACIFVFSSENSSLEINSKTE